MLPGIVQIEVHLPCISVREFTKLKFHNDQASQSPMKKSGSTRYHSVPTPSRFRRAMNAKSLPNSSKIAPIHE
jgi:hypothetical protein